MFTNTFDLQNVEAIPEFSSVSSLNDVQQNQLTQLVEVAGCKSEFVSAIADSVAFDQYCQFEQLESYSSNGAANDKIVSLLNTLTPF